MKSKEACKTPSPPSRRSHATPRHCLVGFSESHITVHKKNACCCVYACMCMCRGRRAVPCVLVWFCTSMSMSKHQVILEVSHSLHASLSEALTHMLVPGCVRHCVCMWEIGREKERECVWCLDHSQTILRQPCSLGAR